MAKPERHLISVDSETGERFEECPGCSQREDVVAGLERKIRGLIMENAKLRRDKEKEARDSGLWPIALRMFNLWRKAAGSKARFKYDRFEVIEPFLRGYRPDKHFVSPDQGPPQNPLEECVAAIIGRTSDYFSTTRPNGTTRKFNEFERIFADSKECEESQARRPRDWRARALAIDAELAPPRDSQSADRKPAPSPEQTALLRPVDRPQNG